jgi:hypothetical protein
MKTGKDAVQTRYWTGSVTIGGSAETPRHHWSAMGRPGQDVNGLARWNIDRFIDDSDELEVCPPNRHLPWPT